MYQRGDLMKLSEVGLNHLYRYRPTDRERAKEWRFQYRCVYRNWDDCVTVLKLPKRYYVTYHKSFVERA